jgi:TRAP transporter TAXI family solute receptor
MAEIVLGAFGLALGDLRVVQLPYDAVPGRFRDGSIDAHLVTGSPPLDAVTEATRIGARLLSLDGAPVGRLHATFPFYRRTLIPAGVYPNHPAPTRTIGVDSLLLCRADLDESLVYDLTRVLFTALPSLASLQLPPIALDQAPATLIPLHPGAARFYRERELSR